MTVPWEFWSGQKVAGVVAFDTETTMVADPAVDLPQLVLATASDGTTSYVLRPDQVSEFLALHEGSEFVCHNVAFDFWVVNHPVLWKAAEENRLHDTMLLDQLVRLAEGKGQKGGIPRRNLGALSAEYCPEVQADKESPYRTQFGYLVGRHWSLVDPGFFDYAAVDAVATRRIYDRLVSRATELFTPVAGRPGVSPDCVQRYGLLTECLQVRAALSLSAVTRNGIAFDRPHATSVEAQLREEIKGDWELLMQECPEMFHVDKKGSYVLTKKGKTYSLRVDVLRRQLELAATSIGQPVLYSSGKTGAVSTSAKLWAQYGDRVPFVGAWARTVTSKDLLKFFDIFNQAKVDRVHPRYEVIKNTGRTGSRNPNIQQTPRTPTFRRCYVAPPGSLLAVVDYSFIELRTLAAVCYATFGRSTLGDVIKAGVDPHVYTAAMINGMSMEEFQGLKTTNPAKFKGDRQSAKACFHPDVEVLTPKGWLKVSELTEQHQVAQFWPETQRVEFVNPLRLTTREYQPLVRVHNEGIDLRVTPDHRMVGYRDNDSPVVCFPDQMNGILRGIWNGGLSHVGRMFGNLNELYLRQAVAIQADGSYNHNKVRFGFKKKRKIERFQYLFPDAEKTVDGDVTCFTVELKGAHRVVLDDEKCFKVEVLLSLPLSLRRVFMHEVKHWDSCVDKKTERFTYASTQTKNTDALQAVAAITGYKTSSYLQHKKNPKHKDCMTVSVKQRNHTRSGTFEVTPLDGLHTVYCLSVPSSFVLVRDGGKVVAVGQCNFGIPGGLGAKKLVDYAKTTYKVNMSLEQAKEFRHRLITDIYPELNDTNGYLASSYHNDVARNLHLPVDSLLDYLRNEFRGRDPMRALYLMGRVLKGQPTMADGTPYDDAVVARCWKALNHLVRQSGRSELFDPVAAKQGSRPLYMAVYQQLVVTLTGRMRDGTDYTDARNTPFQSLAADGAKVALWNLLKAGKKVVAFIHDEIIAEVPQGSAEKELREVEEVMVSSMEEVLNRLVPVACEGAVTPYWAKG